MRRYEDTSIKELEFKKTKLTNKNNRVGRQNEQQWCVLLLLLRKGSYSGEFAAFKLSLSPYDAEKHIAATEVNILFYIIFLTAYESAAASERLEVLYELIKDY